ncbi:hypothetical protein OOU_Y34scaffold00476g33 [Pyricularia oryzae Y34]|uniref:Uncharacterized protein n=2 Tax=Pyricularia oryzae TaxID=318829 RepID=A0AA97P0U6_PYRO3|nr:hypothetical protein OOU_Y34scaffold00476g33 [Pyricularia oryzae Y34]
MTCACNVGSQPPGTADGHLEIYSLREDSVRCCVVA